VVEAEGTEDGERIADGIVAELLPSALVRVRLEGEHQLIDHIP